MSQATDGAEPPDPTGGSGPRADRLTIQQSAIHGAVWTLVHVGVSMPIAFAVNLLLARVLGVVDYGRLAFLTAVMDIVGILVSAGMGSALIQFGSKAHAAGHTEEVAGLLSRVQGYRLMVSMPFSSLAILVLADVDTPILVMALVFGILVPGFLSTATNCLWVENRTAASAKVTMAAGLVTQAAVVAAALVYRTPDAVWLSRIAVGGITSLVNLFVISRHYRLAVLRPVLPRNFPRGWWQFALPSAASALVGGLVMSRSEVFFLQWWGTAADVGLFAMAFGLSVHLFAPAQSLVGPLIPAISGLREVDAEAVKHALLRSARASATVSGLAVAVGMPALAALVPVLYGHEFEAAVPLIVALSISSSLVLLRSPATAFVLARLRSRFLLMTNLVGIAIDVLVALVAIPAWGAWGAVAANAAAALTTTAVIINSERLAQGLPMSTVLRSVSPAVLGGAAGLAAHLLGEGIGEPWLRAPLAAAAGLALYLLLLHLARVGLTSQDRDALVRVAPKRAGRFTKATLGALTNSPAAS